MNVDGNDSDNFVDEEIVDEDSNRYEHCFSFQYDDEVVDRQETNVVSQEHCMGGE